jgi:hypothetical protein
MVPPQIQQPELIPMDALVAALEARRRRDRLYRLAWGLARTASVCVTLLAVCCALDWWIDRSRETPLTLRIVMTVAQAVTAAYCVVRLVLKLNVPSLDDLAARAEQLVPAFGHRLVTALQLNRAGARTDGMSAELIGDLTRDAERDARRPDFPALADRRRLTNAVRVIVPVLVFAVGMTALMPRLVATLVGRQLLLPIAIARPVKLTNATAELWPAGDAVTVTVEASGVPADGADATEGELRVTPEDQPAETFALKFAGFSDAGVPRYAAALPPSSSTLTFRAWLAGGRLREPGVIRFAARPVVQEVEATVILPKYVDPSGKREYARPQPQGEVVALADSSVEVGASFSKPVAGATVVVFRRDAGREVEAGRYEMTLAESREAGSARFAVAAGMSGYRVECVDEHGFRNANPPHRGVSVAADNPPEVSLLPEVLKDPKEEGPIDDFLVDGMPLRLGGQVQVGYAAKSPIGLDRAFLAYRVNDGPWNALPLARTTADESKVGKFLPDLGVFENSGVFGQVEFYPVPAADPGRDPDGLTGGGRYNFKTAGLTKSVKTYDGEKQVPLEVGDTVEIRVVAYDRHPGPTRPPTVPPTTDYSSAADAAPAPPPDPRRAGGWSPESRVKQVVSEARFEAWRQEHYRTRARLAELEESQRAVFREPPPE